MDAKKKSIGLIIIAVIIGGGLLINYIVSGRDSLNKNNNDNIFVEEENEELEENSKENNKQSSSNVKGQGSGEIIELKDNRIVVDIKGEVKNQGVYYLNEGRIVEDLIREAGGITDKASLDLVNRAEKLTNNKCIIIPSKEESNEIKGPQSNNIASMPSSIASTSNDDGNEIININTASIEELDKLPGVGEATANKIVNHREENGEFKSIEEIKNVNGIGDKKFEDMKELICVN